MSHGVQSDESNLDEFATFYDDALAHGHLRLEGSELFRARSYSMA
jgi:hypothetical protein